MTADHPEMRIGDAERDDAVNLLSEHHSEGRLGVDEFNERMEQALSARTMSELRRLFDDLPGRRPGELLQPFHYAAPGYEVASPDSPNEVAQRAEEHYPIPWYAQWWMILIPVFVPMVAGVRLAWLFPVMALWIWVVYPAIHRQRTPRPFTERPRRPLTLEEQQRVMAEVRVGRKIHAIKLYRELSGRPAREAKDN